MRSSKLRSFFIALGLIVVTSAFAKDALDEWYFRDARVVNKVRFVGGMFIGVGNNGLILTSSDGQMWTESTSGTSANLNGVAYGNTVPITTNTYVVVGDGGTILVSTNVVNWTPAGTTTCDLNDVVFIGFRFVATTTRTLASQPNILVSSSDGKVWTDVLFTNNSSGLPYSTGPIISALGGNVVITAGGETIASELWRSLTGGQTWQKVANATQSVSSIAFGTGRFITTGFDGLPFISTNAGSSWFPTPDSNVCNFSEFCVIGPDLAFGNSTFLIVRGSAGGLFTTTNGDVWTKRMGLAGKQFESVAFGKGTFVAAGPDGIYQTEPVSTPGLFITKYSPSNAVNISVAGEVGRGYRLQTSTNLSNWFDRLSFTNTSPTMQFVEPITNGLQLFYRAVTP